MAVSIASKYILKIRVNNNNKKMNEKENTPKFNNKKSPERAGLDGIRLRIGNGYHCFLLNSEDVFL